MRGAPALLHIGLISVIEDLMRHVVAVDFGFEVWLTVILSEGVSYLLSIAFGRQTLGFAEVVEDGGVVAHDYFVHVFAEVFLDGAEVLGVVLNYLHFILLDISIEFLF